MSTTMTKTRLPSSLGYIREFSQTLSIVGNGNSILVPKGMQTVLISLKVTAGEGKVQFTMSSIAEVNAETAVWEDWDAGSVTAALTSDILYPITAIRSVNTSGTTIMFGSAR